MFFVQLPIDAVIKGTPVSAQGSPSAKAEWAAKVHGAFSSSTPSPSWLVSEPVAVTVYVFPEGELAGDLDNRLKHTIDGLKGSVLTDDTLVHRIVAQKFDSDVAFELPRDALPTLLGIVSEARPFVYVKVSSELRGE